MPTNSVSLQLPLSLDHTFLPHPSLEVPFFPLRPPWLGLDTSFSRRLFLTHGARGSPCFAEPPF